jgi:hypothetical protein
LNQVPWHGLPGAGKKMRSEIGAKRKGMYLMMSRTYCRDLERESGSTALIRDPKSDSESDSVMLIARLKSKKPKEHKPS